MIVFCSCFFEYFLVIKDLWWFFIIIIVDYEKKMCNFYFCYKIIFICFVILIIKIYLEDFFLFIEYVY